MALNMDKFLDDDNIITKDENVEDVELTFDDNAEEKPEEEVVKPKPKKRKIPKSSTPKKKEEDKEVVKSAIKTRKEIIADLINRYQEQKIVKEVELDMNHYLYNNGGGNDIRNRCELIIKNLANDIRTLDKKIKFLQEKYKAE